MKIAYIISMVKGGVPAFTYREIDILSKHGFQISLFPLTWRTGPYMPKPEWPVCRVSGTKLLVSQFTGVLSNPIKYFALLSLAIRNKALKEFAVSMCFVGEMKRQGIEHIHCHFGDSKLYTGYFCSKWLGLTMTSTFHAYEIHRNPNPVMLKIAAERCRKIVVQSEFNKTLVMRNFGIGEDKIALIRAHGDMSDPKRAASIKILMVAEFREKKGHEILFSAVKKLNRKDMTVWLVGDGPLDIRGMALKAGVSDQVVFLGMLGKDLLNILYDSCDMFVLPSRTARDGDCEGIPAVLMEAMSHGKPVISTRHAGIPELVEEILVDENDVDGLAEAIEKLADDPELCARLGDRNIDIVKSRFSDNAVLELGEVYKACQGRLE